MAPFRGTPRVIIFLLVVLYGVLLPSLLIETGTAHRFIRNGAWRHSVQGRRLEYVQNTDYRAPVARATTEWRSASTIRVREVDDRRDAEIRVSDTNNCNLPWIGEYDYADDRVRFNKCAMEWDGGVYPGNGENLGSTPVSRRTRTAVHEFGHALGLGHNTLGDCDSILHDDVPYDEVTCYIPTSHDRNDINNYWP